MSLFQCSRCGCLENTSLTNAYHSTYFVEKNPKVLANYREVLGLKDDQIFGKYCSACTPIWFDENGDYGLGPNPNPKQDQGLWHDRFKRRYFPKGEFGTDPQGNLWHCATKDSNIEKWASDVEHLASQETPGKIDI